MRLMWAGALALAAGAVAAVLVTVGHPSGHVDPAGHAYFEVPAAPAVVASPAGTPRPAAPTPPSVAQAPASPAPVAATPAPAGGTTAGSHHHKG